MLTQLGAALVGLADSIMVGHYSTADLAAVSFSNALFFTVMVFAMGALMGITPLVGHVHGRLEKLLKDGTTDDEIAHKHTICFGVTTDGFTNFSYTSFPVPNSGILLFALLNISRKGVSKSFFINDFASCITLAAYFII